jgi:ParB-like chromosome segregation protein Spo0J
LLTAQVDLLAASIKELGLIQPITASVSVDISGIAEPGWQIVSGHHRVAACRALGWTEIDAIIIDKQEHLQTELIEIDENLCRAELTASQRTAFTKRRKQIWEALHPVEQVAHVAPPVAKHGHAQEKSFAAATAESTGQSKATTNRAIARADALGDEALTKVANTSLDSGVELDALAKLDAPERAVLIERAVAGEQVSARTQNTPVKSSSAPARALPMRLYKAVHDMVHGLGFSNCESLIEAIGDLPELSEAEDATLNDALEIFRRIGALEVA